jgi:hypothetical protein
VEYQYREIITPCGKAAFVFTSSTHRRPAWVLVGGSLLFLFVRPGQEEGDLATLFSHLANCL